MIYAKESKTLNRRRTTGANLSKVKQRRRTKSTKSVCASLQQLCDLMSSALYLDSPGCISHVLSNITSLKIVGFIQEQNFVFSNVVCLRLDNLFISEKVELSLCFPKLRELYLFKVKMRYTDSISIPQLRVLHTEYFNEETHLELFSHKLEKISLFSSRPLSCKFSNNCKNYLQNLTYLHVSDVSYHDDLIKQLSLLYLPLLETVILDCKGVYPSIKGFGNFINAAPMLRYIKISFGMKKFPIELNISPTMRSILIKLDFTCSELEKMSFEQKSGYNEPRKVCRSSKSCSIQ